MSHLGPPLGYQPPGGWSCASFSILCLSHQSQMQFHHYFVCSNFHPESDLLFIKDTNDRDRRKSHHLCSHIALYWQLQEETMPLPPTCTGQFRATSLFITNACNGFVCSSLPSQYNSKSTNSKGHPNRCHPLKERV